MNYFAPPVYRQPSDHHRYIQRFAACGDHICRSRLWTPISDRYLFASRRSKLKSPKQRRSDRATAIYGSPSGTHTRGLPPPLAPNSDSFSLKTYRVFVSFIPSGKGYVDIGCGTIPLQVPLVRPWPLQYDAAITAQVLICSCDTGGQ